MSNYADERDSDVGMNRDLDASKYHWLAHEIYIKLLNSPGFHQKITCNGCKRQFNYNQELKLAEFEFHFHCIEDCPRYHDFLRECDKCKKNFIAEEDWEFHQGVCGALFD